MKTLFLALLLCATASLRLKAQSTPALPAVQFAWDEPDNLAGIFAYRLQWRTGSVILPVGTTNETVQYFPSGFSETVGISSMAVQGESPTNQIKVMSVLAHFQSDRGDGAGWHTRTSLWFVLQLQSNEMFRVKLEARP